MFLEDVALLLLKNRMLMESGINVVTDAQLCVKAVGITATS